MVVKQPLKTHPRDLLNSSKRTASRLIRKTSSIVHVFLRNWPIIGGGYVPVFFSFHVPRNYFSFFLCESNTSRSRRKKHLIESRACTCSLNRSANPSFWPVDPLSLSLSLCLSSLQKNVITPGETHGNSSECTTRFCKDTTGYLCEYRRPKRASSFYDQVYDREHWRECMQVMQRN